MVRIPRLVVRLLLPLPTLLWNGDGYVVAKPQNQPNTRRPNKLLVVREEWEADEMKEQLGYRTGSDWDDAIQL